VSEWGINWTYSVELFGQVEERELVQGGKNKLVTEENKQEYVKMYCYQKMAKDIEEQIKAFLSGFHELIPQQLISIFEWKEMELMLCGLPDIDVSDMKENCEYNGYEKESQVVQWLWELLESYDKSKRAAFIQFITGTSKVPLGGFKELRGMHGP
jgi:E3 ubiquitin-protein ligase HUWE1